MIYDCIIVGGGPAGLTAGIYLARANKKVAIIEKLVFGGQVAEIGQIENYPGFASISGSELSMNMYKQAKSLGVEFIVEEALDYDFKEEIKKVKTNRKTLETKTIILALGSVAKQLNVINENKFIGRGVSYCATCDGNFFKSKVVAVVGSGDSAISNAQYLSSLCKKVFIISKYESLKVKSANANDLLSLQNIKPLFSTRVVEIIGEEQIEGIKIERDGQIEEISLDGIFVSIGRSPDTQNLKDMLTIDENGYIITDSEMRTNVEGVFAAGDVVSKNLKQIVSAASSGAVAGTSALKYLITKKL